MIVPPFARLNFIEAGDADGSTIVQRSVTEQASIPPFARLNFIEAGDADGSTIVQRSVTEQVGIGIIPGPVGDPRIATLYAVRNVGGPFQMTEARIRVAITFDSTIVSMDNTIITMDAG